MADKIKTKAARKSSGSALDKAMSAFAAASVGFAAYVMPADLFTRLVQGSGLPAILPAARPPLGDTARVALVIAATLATFLGVWLLLRALGKAPASRKGKKPVEVASEPPRLRRADMHPDAPSRSPISAGRELGVPLDDMPVDERGAEKVDLEEVENVDYEAEWERPLPGFIEEETLAQAEVDEPSSVQEAEEVEGWSEVEPEPELTSVDEDSSDRPFWVPEEASADEVVEEIGQVDAPAEEPAESNEPAVMPFWAEAPEETDEVPEEDEAEEETAPTASLIPQEQHDLDELGQRLPKKQALEHESIDGLVERFETGVGRRKRGGWTSGQSAPVSEEDKKLEERLRGAISDLRRISRG
nr:hypothetical protein [uncultured Sphingosinicella sp.]